MRGAEMDAEGAAIGRSQSSEYRGVEWLVMVSKVALPTCFRKLEWRACNIILTLMSNQARDQDRGLRALSSSDVFRSSVPSAEPGVGEQQAMPGLGR